MTLDFKEIPQANQGGGMQDTFELFARDFLEDVGFKILQHPDRGADGKKDLIVKEIRKGVGGETSIIWLVSCKHYAHSGKSVSDTDEPDISDRLLAHGCDAFMGFYSTLPATSLGQKLTNQAKFEFLTYDRERIEKQLLNHNSGVRLANRYFPESIKKHMMENPTPAEIFSTKPPLNCDYCSKDLLVEKNGMIVFLREHHYDTESKIPLHSKDRDAYFCCKGDCDQHLKARFQAQGLWDSGWMDLDDLMIPTGYLKYSMGSINSIRDGKFEHELIEKLKHMYMRLFPHVARNLTTPEKERINDLLYYGLL